MTRFSSTLLSIILIQSFWIIGVYGQLDQNLSFTNFSNLDGLPNNSVNVIQKDDLGFVWIGTNDGLCRYETPGSLTIYKANNPSIEGGLQSSNIRALFLDSKQNLWIGTRLGGLTKFHQRTGSWATYKHDKEDPSSICNDEILDITEDSKGRIWVGTENGLSVYNHDTDSFFSYEIDKEKSGSLKAKAVLTIFEDNKGWIWVGTWEGGLSLLTLPEDGNIEKGVFKSFFPRKKLQANRVWEIFQDNENRFWLGTASGGLFLMQLPKEAHNTLDDRDWNPKFHNYANEGGTNSITNDDIKSILQDSNNNLWIGTSNGLNCMSYQDIEKLPANTITIEKPDVSFYHYFNDPTDPKSLISNYVRTIIEDNQGIIWTGTFGGISQYNSAVNQFDVHPLDNALTKNPVSQNLYVDPKGIAWFGNGENGILKYDLDNNKIIDNIELDAENNFVASVYSRDDKNLYIGHRVGISVLEMNSGTVKHHFIFEDIQQQHQNYLPVRSIYKDLNDRIWVGSENGLFIINEKTGNYKQFFTSTTDKKSISDNTINHIYEDSKGSIWLATYQGLNRVIEFGQNNYEFERFKYDAKNPNSTIPSNRISSLVEVDGILYIGSGNGLSGYDLNNGTFTNFSKNNNKYSFRSINKTEQGDIWGTTREGLVEYNIKANTFNLYSRTDGLMDLDFLAQSSFVDKDGSVYLGSKRGITRFDPKQFVKNDIAPPVYITDVRKLGPGGEMHIDAMYEDEIVLNHNDYYLSINYAALNYNRPEKNHYAVMLEGFDDRWIELDKNSPAIYTNLKHGTYYFKVKASNNDGVWVEEPTSLKIIKKAAFWETWWFYVLCILTTALLLFLAIKFYTKSVNQRNSELELYNENLSKEITQRKLAESELQKQKIDLKSSNFNLERTNTNLERSNKDLEQFAYIASHDLQEPLRVVGNFVGILKHKYADKLDDKAIDYIDFAVDGVTRMSEQIRSILDFSGVIQSELNYELTDLNTVIANKRHDLSEKINEKNVQFEVGELPEIYCDKNLMDLVFHNLISNGIKFNKSENPLITIKFLSDNDSNYWKFCVKDNGIGIHPDAQKDLFEVFTRVHSKSDYEGTGIGLALCKRIINRQGGEIWLESEEGQGTIIHFTIEKHEPALV